MDALLGVATEYELKVVDDAAHALPASLCGRRIGALGCPTAFSFYATKTLTTGEGGMFCTDDERLADRARLMSLHGISRDAWKRYTAEGSWFYEVIDAGYKYNLTDIAAALGRVQLRRTEGMCERRAAIAAKYTDAFQEIEEVEAPCVRRDVSHAWHLYPIRLRLERLRIDRARFIEELRRRQIGTSVHFVPLHTQPFYLNRYRYLPEDFPITTVEYPRLVSLPIYSRMTNSDVEAVVAAIHDVLEHSRR